MISELIKNKIYILIALFTVTCNPINTYAAPDSQKEEGVLAAIKDAKELNIEKDKRFNDLLVETDKTIFETLAKANEALDALIKTVIQTSEIDSVTRENLEKKVNLVKADIESLKNETSTTITTMRAIYLSEGNKVISAYDDYSKEVSRYYAGEIDKDELVNAGKTFKETVGAIDSGSDKEKIDSLVAAAKDIDVKTKLLQEDILNEISNNKDYSDEDDEEDIGKTSLLNDSLIQRYSYNYHTEHNHIYLKSEYASVDRSFLLSSELACDELRVEKLDEDVKKLRDCVVRAKTEKEYFAVKGLCGCHTSKLEKCDPFKNSGDCSLYNDYRNKGVYKHILEDYDAANVGNIAKTKQYAHAWQGKYEDNAPYKCIDGTKCELQEKIEEGSSDNTRAAYQLLSMVEIEAPKNWSYLRRVDALHRAKKAVNYFMGADKLYLDGRPDGYTSGEGPYSDFAQATNTRPGYMDKKDIKATGVEADVGQDVAPNVLLYVCGLNAKDVSLSIEDAGDTEKVQAVEKEIAKCMKKYATWVDKGTDQDKQTNEHEANENKKLWREKELGAATDSMFSNFTAASINLYKSSIDYQENAPEDNIVSLKKEIEEATEGLDDYAVGAKINYYTTNQLLSIINADAIELQTEIIQHLGELGYNFFFIENEGGN